MRGKRKSQPNLKFVLIRLNMFSTDKLYFNACLHVSFKISSKKMSWHRSNCKLLNPILKNWSAANASVVVHCWVVLKYGTQFSLHEPDALSILFSLLKFRVDEWQDADVSALPELKGILQQKHQQLNSLVTMISKNKVRYLWLCAL